MTPPPPSSPGAAAHDPRSLLANAGWVRRLARSLVDDEHLAEDLVQEALLVAFRRRPGGDVPGSWFAGVLRNLAARSRRGRVRRGRRERAAARTEAQPATDDLVERVALHRAVVDAVMSLDDPYRTAVLLRYLEELPPRRIAERLGLSVDTVRTHVQRGVLKLRERLDRDRGGREGWLPGLIVLCELPAESGTLLGALIMSTKLKVALAGTLGLVGALAVVRVSGVLGGAHGAAEPVGATASVDLVDPGEPLAAAPDPGPRLATETPPAAEPAPLATAPTAAAETLLQVRAIARETQAALAGVRVIARVADDPPRNPRFAPGPRGSIEEAPRTGEDGLAELSVPPDRRLVVTARSEAFTTGSAEISVPALARGETRELVVELVTEPDRHFHGRVVTHEDGTPIGGARVRIDDVATWRASGGDGERGAGAYEARTRPDGTFDLWLPSWRPLVARVTAPERGAAFFGVTGAHAAPDRERLVRLRPECGVAVSVSGDAEGLEVRLGVESYYLIPEGTTSLAWAPAPFWRGRLDAGGRCAVAGLPANVPLQLEVLRKGRPVHHAAEPLTLAPGERREVAIVLGSGSALRGSLRDQEGEAIARRGIWLKRADVQRPRFLESFDQVDLRTRTDANGEFLFDEVGTGTWWVGPAPDRAFGAPPAANSIAALAQVVTISAGGAAPRVELTVHRGLYVRGRAVGADGEAVPYAHIMGFGPEGLAAPLTRSGPDGAFAVGPLVPGSWRLQGRTFGNADVSNAAPVTVQAGDEGVVLEFASGGSISGRIARAATGEPVDYEIQFLPSTGIGAPAGLGSLGEELGRYERTGLEPGTYNVVARTSDGGVAVRAGVEVHAGQEVTGVDLEVAPGARLVIHVQEGARGARIELWNEGVYLGVGGVQTGTRWSQVLPAGRILVKARGLDGEGTVKETVELAPGDEREVSIRFGS